MQPNFHHCLLLSIRLVLLHSLGRIRPINYTTNPAIQQTAYNIFVTIVLYTYEIKDNIIIISAFEHVT